VSHAKTAEAIKMPFASRTRVPRKTPIRYCGPPRGEYCIVFIQHNTAIQLTLYANRRAIVLAWLCLFYCFFLVYCIFDSLFWKMEQNILRSDQRTYYVYQIKQFANTD